jgi:lysophospholipase L1-like esterase
MARHGNRLSPARPGEDVYWSSNSWGFRGPEFSAKKPPDVIRIVCLGASTTEGSQGDQETYPYFLQQQLLHAFPGRVIEVINAGHHGQTVEDLLEILKQRVLPLQPDVVIFYEASNNLVVGEFVADTDPAGWRQKMEHWLYESSALFELIADRLGWMTYMPHDFDLGRPKPNVARYRQTLREIVQETIEHGSLMVLSSFVTVAHAGLRVSYKENPLLFHSLYREYEPLTPGEIAQVYAHVNRQSAEVAREFCVPYADIASQFPRDLRYFPFDLIHLTPEGNRKLAAMFASLLEKEVLPQLPAWRDRQRRALGTPRSGEVWVNCENSSNQRFF